MDSVAITRPPVRSSRHRRSPRKARACFIALTRAAAPAADPHASRAGRARSTRRTTRAAAPRRHRRRPAGPTGRTPSSRLRRSCASPAAPTIPIARPSPTSTGALPQHQAQDLAARAAERHPDPDLARAARHLEGQHAVEPDRREQQAEDAEQAEQLAAHALAEVRGADEGRERRRRVRGDARSRAAARAPSPVAASAAGSPARAQQQRHVRPVALFERQEEPGRRLLAEVAVGGVARDAHDGDPLLAEAEAPAHGLAPRPVARGHRRVDDRDARDLRAIVGA